MFALVGAASIFVPGLHADPAPDTNSIAQLLKLVEQQNQKIDALSEKVRQLEEREQHRDTTEAVTRLPAIVIDTNGVPVGALPAVAADSGPETMPRLPLSQLSAGAGGFSFRSADTNFVLTMHGLLQADSRSFFKDSEFTQGDDGFIIRRARPILEGTVFRDVDFLLVPDFGLSTVLLYDASATYRFAPWLQLTAGKFKGPVGLEQLQTDAAASLNERSLASDLVPVRNVGAQLSGQFRDGLFMWAGGIYDAGGDNRIAGNTPLSNDLEFGGRLFVQPFINTPANWLRGFGVGIGGSYSDVSSNSAALPATLGGAAPGFLTTGQQQFFAYNPLLGPVVADGSHSRLSPEGYYFLGPFGVQAEYILERQGVLNAFTLQRANLANDGWQVTAQWVLTGEDASFNAIKPLHPFDLRAGHWGAWQLVARYSALDIDPDAFKGFSDSTASAQSATAWTVGLNWWLNANVRWMISFSHTTFHGGGAVNADIPSTLAPPATVTHQDENVLFTRIQLAF